MRSVAPARISATPSFTRIVRSVRPVFMLPSKPTRPIAPPYHARELRSCASMNRIAQSLGAPVTVTAHACVRNASIASKPSRRMPSTWSTVWMTREYISICRRPMKPLRRPRGARLEEHPAGHDLEEIAAAERLLREADGRGEFSGLVVAGPLDRTTPAVRRRVTAPRQTRRRRAVDRELVLLSPGDAPGVVDDDEPVRQKENEIALRRFTHQAIGDRLELEREVVAERAVQAEVTVLGAVEEVDERAHDREDGALLRAIFLGEPLARRRDGAAHSVGRGLESRERVEMGEACGDRREEHATAVVERVDREVAVPCDELQRRVDEANVPPRVPPRGLVAGGEEDPPVRVERRAGPVEPAPDRASPGLPAHPADAP